MARKSRPIARETPRESDAGEMQGRHWPEELMMRIMIYLPLLNLLQFRTASRRWSTMILDPHFPRALCQEFMSYVVSSRCWKLFFCMLEHSTGTLLIMSGSGRDLFAVEPLRLSIRMLPRLNVSRFGAWRTDLTVVGSVVDEITKEFTVFVVSTLYFSIERFHRLYRACHGHEPVGGPAIVSIAEKLFCYNSATGIWTPCGRGLDLTAMWRQVLGVTMHLGRYIVLVKTITGFREGLDDYSYDINAFCYDMYTGIHFAWQRLPGDFPRLDNLPGVGSLCFGTEGVSLFDHNGILYVAAASYTGCLLLKYDGDTFIWSLVRNFRNPIPIDVERGPGYWVGMRFPFSQVFGDYLHFGAFVPFTGRYETRCRILTYNLVTGKVEDMSYDQAHVRLIEKDNGGQSRLLQLE